jgi:hypothetical protein
MASSATPRALPPVSRAHQAGLQALISSLQASGQDVALLTQLAESLPRLRAGLNGADRQRIEALDANEPILTEALFALHGAIDRFDTANGPDDDVSPNRLLVDAPQLQQLAQAAQAVAEAATDLALRAAARAALLQGE